MEKSYSKHFVKMPQIGVEIRTVGLQKKPEEYKKNRTQTILR